MAFAPFDNLLSLPPFVRARKFIELAKQWKLRASETFAPSQARYGTVAAQVHALSINSQYALLGLPEALLGLRHLEGPLVPAWAMSVAEELAQPALDGPFGTRELDEDNGAWITEAISICRHNWETAALKSTADLAQRFFQAARILVTRHPQILFKEIYGVVFPIRDSLDPVFVDMDRLARSVGGMRLLDWIQAESGQDHDLLRDMLISYACKYIRKEDKRKTTITKTSKPLEELITIASSLCHLLRLERTHDMGARWGLAPFVLEEVVRGAMTHALNGDRRLATSTTQFVDYLVQKAAAPLPGWSTAKAWFERPVGTIMARPRPDMKQWCFDKPDPCRVYGNSFRNSLQRDLGRRPLITLAKNRTMVGPRPSNSQLVFEVRERLGLSQAEIGTAFEDFVEVKLSRTSTVTRGVYRCKNKSDDAGDIDALLMSNDGSLAAAFECKAVSELRDEWTGGDHTMLEHFRRAFLKSQEQLLRLEKTLCAEGSVSVERGGTTRNLHAPGELLRVSVALRSHGEPVHRPGFANALLSHFCDVSFHFESTSGTPMSRDVSASEADLTKLRTKIQEHIATLETFGVPRDAIVSRTLFINLDILVYLTDNARSTDQLLAALKDAATHKGIGKIITS